MDDEGDNWWFNDPSCDYEHANKKIFAHRGPGLVGSVERTSQSSGLPLPIVMSREGDFTSQYGMPRSGGGVIEYSSSFANESSPYTSQQQDPYQRQYVSLARSDFNAGSHVMGGREDEYDRAPAPHQQEQSLFPHQVVYREVTAVSSNKPVITRIGQPMTTTLSYEENNGRDSSGDGEFRNYGLPTSSSLVNDNSYYNKESQRSFPRFEVEPREDRTHRSGVDESQFDFGPLARDASVGHQLRQRVSEDLLDPSNPAALEQCGRELSNIAKYFGFPDLTTDMLTTIHSFKHSVVLNTEQERRYGIRHRHTVLKKGESTIVWPGDEHASDESDKVLASQVTSHAPPLTQQEIAAPTSLQPAATVPAPPDYPPPPPQFAPGSILRHAALQFATPVTDTRRMLESLQAAHGSAVHHSLMFPPASISNTSEAGSAYHPQTTLSQNMSTGPFQPSLQSLYANRVSPLAMTAAPALQENHERLSAAAMRTTEPGGVLTSAPGPVSINPSSMTSQVAIQQFNVVAAPPTLAPEPSEAEERRQRALRVLLGGGSNESLVTQAAPEPAAATTNVHVAAPEPEDSRARALRVLFGSGS